MEVRDVVRNLALEGSAHFQASYVAQEAHISTEQAHEQLAALGQEGVLDVNFDVVCPDSDRTIGTFHLKEEVPFGQIYVEPTGDCEPFELAEKDILVTYTPTPQYVQRLLREGSKKKYPPTTRRHRLLEISSRMLPSISGTLKPRNRSSSSKTVPAPRSSRSKARALPGR